MLSIVPVLMKVAGMQRCCRQCSGLLSRFAGANSQNSICEGLLQAALLDVRAKHVAASRGRTEGKDSPAVLQLLGVAKALLTNVSSCPTCNILRTLRSCSESWCNTLHNCQPDLLCLSARTEIQLALQSTAAI